MGVAAKIEAKKPKIYTNQTSLSMGVEIKSEAKKQKLMQIKPVYQCG